MATLSYSDIQTRVMNQLRLPTSNTTEATKIAALVNEVYRTIAAMQDWWWLVKRGVINTVDDISTGTVAATNGSTALTFSSAPTVSVAGYMFLVPADTTDSGAVYRVASHSASSTSATLDANYTGATATAASYNLYRDTYSLPTDLNELLWVKRFGYTWPISPVAPSEMFGLKLYDTSVGKPEIYTVDDFATSGDPTTARQLIVHPYPDNTYRLELNYKQVLNTELSGSTRPLIPDDYVNLLIYGTLADGYVIYLNNLERGSFYDQRFNALLARMSAVHKEKTGEAMKMQPRDAYRQFYRQGRRATPATADLGSFFGRWPNRP